MAQPMPKPENQAKWLEVIQLFAAGGYSQKEMAEKVGISESQIYRWKQTKEFQEALRLELKNKIADYVGMAIKNIATLAVTAESETVRLNANKELLEKYGVTSKQEIDINASHEIVIDIIGGEEDAESED